LDLVVGAIAAGIDIVGSDAEDPWAAPVPSRRAEEPIRDL
jgi:hypothetical protein